MSRQKVRGRETGRIGLLEGWRAEPLGIRLLRGFLGVTFTYAGIQKLTDPGYLSSTSPTFIGTQLKEFARGSPIAWLLHPLFHFPLIVGIGVVVAELAIGLGTLIGIAPLTMAIGGTATSLVLWLSATWHVHPYFLGSDSIYAVAWAAFAITIWESRRSLGTRREHATGSRVSASGVDRRAFLRTGVLATAALVVGAFAKAFAPDATPSTSSAIRDPIPTPSTPVGRPSTSAVHGKQIADLNQLSIGKPVGFTAHGGEPSVLFKTSDTDVVAFSRVCTHEGCIVDYDASSKLLYCPCHGAEFDPAHGARVVAGPAPVPLPKVNVEVDPSTGGVVLPAKA